MKMTFFGWQALSSLIASKPMLKRPLEYCNVVTQAWAIAGLAAG